jgi:hypothetical protein
MHEPGPRAEVEHPRRRGPQVEGREPDHGRADLTGFVTYDTELAEASTELGFPVSAPA